MIAFGRKRSVTVAKAVVLVVDDEVRSQEALRRTLEEDFTVLTAGSADEAAAIMAREFVHILLCDQRMPGTSGVDFLRQVRVQWPDTVRIIISGFTEAEDIIAGINEAGIWQYILKPWHPEQLLLTLRGAADLWRLQQANQRLTLELRDSPAVLQKRVKEKRGQARAEAAFSRLARSAQSPLNEVCRIAERVAQHELSILITGESGTGKELLARAVHYASRRADGAFVVENCGALPDTLLESELFGHKRGAYTGAFEDRIGLFQQADGGTIFLDEIGETSPAFQVKLLRALQEGEIRPLGSPRPISVDVRVIAATNRDLAADVQSGRFREDLYYRLAGMTLHLPPLRERPMDIPLIAAELLEQGRQQTGKRGALFTPDTLRCLEHHPWPGNVRELQNEVMRMLALGDGDWLGTELLSPAVRGSAANGADPMQLADGEGSLRDRMERIEAEVIRETLIRQRGNKSRAAEELGLSRVGLRSKLARYGLEPDE
ncbi:MAG: sigma-54-dependent Fis family transcriptional regulator [Rhodocyclales bacterium]|nr:sigma-54-dependent Fis family transcriptional regulator [Rhodocyclales bacterium]